MKIKLRHVIGAVVVTALVVGLAMTSGKAPSGTASSPAPLAAGISTTTTAAPAATPVAGAMSVPIGTIYDEIRILGNDTTISTTLASVRTWLGTSDPTSSATGNNPVETTTPNTAVASILSTNVEYKRVASGANFYPLSEFGVDANGNALKGSFPSRCITGCDTITQRPTDWARVRYIAVPNDTLNEGSPFGDQSLNAQTLSSLNGTGVWRGDSGTQGMSNCLAVGDDASPANGNTLHWNNTNCGGSITLRLTPNSGTRSYTWQYQPGFQFSDVYGNFSSTGVASASISHYTTQGGQYHLPSVNLADIINAGRCMMLYEPTNPWVPSNVFDTMAFTMTPSATSWTAGMGFNMDFRDLVSKETCTGGDFITAGTNGTGWAQNNNNHRIVIERYQSDA